MFAFRRFLRYLKSLIAIDRTYASAAAAKRVAGDDVVEILAAGLKAAQSVIELSDQWPATFSRDAARRRLRSEASKSREAIWPRLPKRESPCSPTSET